MKVLFMEWKSFGNEDMKEAFENLGHSVISFPFSNKEPRKDADFEAAFIKVLHPTVPDIVFSFNYFPIISILCKKENIPYISWIYDSPYVLLYSYTVINPCNYIFVFDKELYMEFHHAGINTVLYLPMAANTKRLSSMNGYDTFFRSPYKNQHEVSFIGSLYTEKHQFYSRLDKISSYTKGYLEGIMAAQSKVYGYNFIQELLSKEIIEDMYASLPMEPNPDGVESKEYLFAQYVLNRQLTAIERQDLLSAAAARFSLDLYTSDRDFTMPGAVNHGPVDYYEMAPYIFKTSKINLNISLRSIKSGMPLRIFDIMGAGGFLLTNFQADFLDYFIPDEDFVYYESKEDMLSKTAYYLEHEEERSHIAQNGFRKIAKAHTYEHRIHEMLNYLK